MSAPEHLAGLTDAASHLKHAETADKSAPQIDGGMFKKSFYSSINNFSQLIF